MFVDASALVAVMTDESDARELASRIDAADQAFTSPIAVFEVIMALARKRRQAPAVLLSDLRVFLAASGIRVMPVDESTGEGAVNAQTLYGKVCGHPAQLNTGDCFAYAMAKQHRVPLLYKGEDFARTDLA